MTSPGVNGALVTDGFGSFNVKVMRLGLDLSIVSSTEDASTHETFYPADVTSSDFYLILAFSTWSERERFNRWMRRFMESVFQSKATSAKMKVVVPSHDFSRSAVPQGPIQYGRGSRDVAYFVRISFVGAIDPADKVEASVYRPAQTGAKVSSHFYPAGTQLKGAAALDENLYQSTPDGTPDYNPFDTSSSTSDSTSNPNYNPFTTTPDLNPFTTSGDSAAEQLGVEDIG